MLETSILNLNKQKEMQNCQLVRVGTKTYRQYTKQKVWRNFSTSTSVTVIPNDEDEPSCLATNDKQVAEKVEIPSIYHKFLVGHKGATKKSLERNTNTIITIPPKDNYITIQAANQIALQKAKNEIDQIISKNQNKLPYTHFFSLPLVTQLSPTLTTDVELNAITDQITREFGFNNRLFISPKKLHFTIQMLRIHNLEQMKVMKTLLQDKIQSEFNQLFNNGDSYIEFSHFTSFSHHKNNDGEVSVIYLAPKKNETYDRVVKLNQAVKDILYQNNLITRKEYEEEFVMHATVMNSKYAKTKFSDKPKGFEAADFLSKYSTENHPSLANLRIPIKKLELSKLAVEKGDVMENGYYVCEDRVTIP